MNTGAMIAHFADADGIKMLMKPFRRIKAIIIPKPVNPSAFKRSAIENIRYGNLEATDEECYKAAKEVRIPDKK